MNQIDDYPIKAVYVGLRRSPLRVVFHQRARGLWDRYDVFKPFSKIDGVVEVLKQLQTEKLGFATALVAIDRKACTTSGNRINRYVALEREHLYRPDRIDLVRSYSRLVGQVWLATNLNTWQMVEVIAEACKAASVDFKSITELKL